MPLIQSKQGVVEHRQDPPMKAFARCCLQTQFQPSPAQSLRTAVRGATRAIRPEAHAARLPSADGPLQPAISIANRPAPGLVRQTARQPRPPVAPKALARAREPAEARVWSGAQEAKEGSAQA